MQRGDPKRRAFNSQRNGAKRRNIKFLFTFDEWVAWWETNLGPDWFQKRGTRFDKYVMSRKGDKGSYHPNNVKCVLSVENHAEHGFKSDEDIKAIFADLRSHLEIAKVYNISPAKVGAIKKREICSELTKDMPRLIRVKGRVLHFT